MVQTKRGAAKPKETEGWNSFEQLVAGVASHALPLGRPIQTRAAAGTLRPLALLAHQGLALEVLRQPIARVASLALVIRRQVYWLLACLAGLGVKNLIASLAGFCHASATKVDIGGGTRGGMTTHLSRPKCAPPSTICPNLLPYSHGPGCSQSP